MSNHTRHQQVIDARPPPIRWGMTIPLGDEPLHAQRDRIAELQDLGFTDVWSSESNAHDAFTPLALASVWAPSLRLGTAIVPAFTRGRACLAQSAGSLGQAAPGRVALGIGASSGVVVEQWNGIPFAQPYEKVRETLRFLRAALSGERCDGGFRLAALPPEPVPILIAALRSGMLRLAGREADGAIVNWLSADDVRQVAAIVRGAAATAGRPPPEICGRVLVAPGSDEEAARALGRRAIAAYLTVPVYAEFHRWLGRGEMLSGLWTAWAAGDRKAAIEAIPDAVVDDLVVWGPPERCREELLRFVDGGVTTLVLAPLLPVHDVRRLCHDLAPR